MRAPRPTLSVPSSLGRLKALCRDAKEGGDVGTDDGVAFSGTVGSRLDSQMTRGVCNTRRLDEITVSCHHSISKSISFSGFVKTSNNSLSPFPKS